MELQGKLSRDPCMGGLGLVVRFILVEMEGCAQVPDGSSPSQSPCERRPALSSLSPEEVPRSRNSVPLVQSCSKLSLCSPLGSGRLCCCTQAGAQAPGGC